MIIDSETILYTLAFIHDYGVFIMTILALIGMIYAATHNPNGTKRSNKTRDE